MLKNIRWFVALVAIVSFLVAAPGAVHAAGGSSLSWSVTCSSVSGGGTVGSAPGSFAFFSLSTSSPAYSYSYFANVTGGFSFSAAIPAQPVGASIFIFAKTESGVLFSGVIHCANAPVAGPAAQFWNPNDGRVDGHPGDRLAVWCRSSGMVDVWGVGNDSRGFRLAMFYYKDLVTAGPKGLTKSADANGTISLAVDTEDNFYAAWNGGKYGANGRGGFAKAFRCQFDG